MTYKLPNDSLTFVIPTKRLREVGETVMSYDQNFHEYGSYSTAYAPSIVVFDDSGTDMHKKYFGELEGIQTHQDVFYVGPREKEQFIALLNSKIEDKRLEPLIRSIFRQSYGGNRNFTLMYTLGGLMISSDDDMRPYCLMERNPERLEKDEVARGRLHKANDYGYQKVSFDIASAFVDVLGKPIFEIRNDYEVGELIKDTSMDLITNTSNGLAQENSMVLQKGYVPSHYIVKMAQTYRSGTNDIDQIDFVDMFLEDKEQRSLDSLNDVYVLNNFRPVITKNNWRMDCGVAGYDNSMGLPPFFPTKLRFEDYIYRIWIQQDGIAAAHVDAAQHHTKSNYMRNPPASELLNEELCKLLKQKIRSSVNHIDQITIGFDYNGELTLRETSEILDRAKELRGRVLKAAARTNSTERKKQLLSFAANIVSVYSGFDTDFFYQNMLRRTKEEINFIKGSLKLWPTLIAIVSMEKLRDGLPMAHIENKKL